jgi:hypothetical protein
VDGFIPYGVLKSLLKGYEENKFINNIRNKIPFPFNMDDIEKVVSSYFIGTITKGYWRGAAAMPFIDIDDNVRAIQVKQFDENNHTIGTNFLHSMAEKHYIKNKQELPTWLKNYIIADRKVSCLFGEHLLKKYPTNTIALVEAPKTALIGTLYFGFPDNPKNLLWLAVYNKSSFSKEKVEVLTGRKVVVFPDLSYNGKTYKEWEAKAMDFMNQMPNTQFILSDFLEKKASDDDKLSGLDIADYLIQCDWRMFRESLKSDVELAELEKINRRIKHAS